MPKPIPIPSNYLPPFWAWTAYTPVIPELYWNVYSQEERIKRLCLEYDKLVHYASTIAGRVNDLSDDITTKLEEFTKQVTEQLAEQDAKIEQMIADQNKRVDSELEEMREYIDKKFEDMSLGVLSYDVTTGSYRPTEQTMRRLFQALSYDHKGDEQLVSYYAENKTVEEMATQTVYNVAYSNLPSIVIDDQLQHSN